MRLRPLLLLFFLQPVVFAQDAAQQASQMATQQAERDAAEAQRQNDAAIAAHQQAVRNTQTVGSAASASGQEQFAGVAAACGPKKVNFDAKRDDSQHSLPQVEPGKAQLVVIQDMGVMACLGVCITTKIGVDGAWVGAIQHNSYFSLSIDPGEHHVCANRQSHFSRANQMVALAHFTAEGGKVYYLRTRTFGDREQALMDLDQVDSDEGRYLVSLYPLSVSHSKP